MFVIRNLNTRHVEKYNVPSWLSKPCLGQTQFNFFKSIKRDLKIFIFLSNLVQISFKPWVIFKLIRCIKLLISLCIIPIITKYGHLTVTYFLYMSYSFLSIFCFVQYTTVRLASHSYSSIYRNSNMIFVFFL